MSKRGNFIIVFLILLFIAIGNIYIYFSKMRISIMGFSVKNVGFGIFTGLKTLDFSTIAFIVQWLLILIVVIFFYVKFLKHKKEEEGKKSVINVERKKGTDKAETDLDTFYNLLKEKKHIKISDVSKIFKIDNEKALEWCKILENHELASIEYPAFSEPEIEIK